MAQDMIKLQLLLKYLLIIALTSQLLIDVGGFTGIFFSAYPSDTYIVSGTYSLLNIRQTMALFFVGLFMHYCSIFAMMKKLKVAVPFIVIGFVLSFLSSFSMGVNVANPIDLLLGWITSTAYLVAVGLFIFSEQLKDKTNVR